MNTNYELLIQKLDAFIRKFYLNKLLRGTLLFVGLLFGFFLFISLFEYQLYLSSAVRKFLLFGFIATSATALVFLVAQPLVHFLKLRVERIKFTSTLTSWRAIIETQYNT